MGEMLPQSRYGKVTEFLKQCLSVSEEVRDREGQGNACNNLGYAFAKNDDDTRAARVFPLFVGEKKKKS